MRKPEGGARSALVTSGALALSGALNFAALFIWVRVLGPEEFGIFALATGTALLINATCFEWLRVVAARTLYSREGVFRIDAVRANAIAFFVLAVTVVLIMASGLMFWLRVWPFGFDATWIPLVIGLTISEMLLALLNVTSRIRMLPWQFFVTMVARSFVSIVLGLLFVIVFDWGVSGVLAAVVAAQFSVAGVIMYRDRMWRELRPGHIDDHGAAARREVLALGLPLIAANALSYGAGIVDRYLVKASLGAASVGYYSAPSDMLAKTLGMIMLAINIVAYPALVRAYDDHGAESARDVLEKSFVAQLALGAPIVVAFCVIPAELASVMLGSSYRSDASVLFPLLAGAVLLRFLISNHLMMIFQVKREMRLMLLSPCVALIVTVPTGLLWMRSSGLVGMAYAFLLAQSVSWLACALVAKRIFDFSIFTGDVRKVFFASLVMVFVLRYVSFGVRPLEVIMSFILGSLTYLFALVALRLKVAQPILRPALGIFHRRFRR